MKKIMFNDRFGLTKAVLEGRKTQTRRATDSATHLLIYDHRKALIGDKKNKDEEIVKNKLSEFASRFSPYKVGDILAVAQSYKDCGIFNDNKYMRLSSGWSNKMFVRADLMPHHIKIDRIRVERLRLISDEDCLAEGIWEDGGDDAFMPRYFYNYENSGKDGFQKPWLAYADLIERISGKGMWRRGRKPCRTSLTSSWITITIR